MARGNSNGNYGNGYAVGVRGNASLPSRIKCNVCGTVKPSDNYSTKQLDLLKKKLRDTPAFDAAKMPYITCVSDTSKQVVELECQKCDKWMGLNKFYKAQRSDPDNAECIKCVTERVDEEPYVEGRDDAHDDSASSGQGGSGSSDEEDDHHIQGATGSMASMSMSNGQSTFPSQHGSSSAGGGVSLSTAPTSQRNTSKQGSSVAGSASTVRTTGPSFDPNKYSSKSTTTTTKSRKGDWAKPEAGKKKPTAKKVDSDSDDFDEDKAVISDSD